MKKKKQPVDKFTEILLEVVPNNMSSRLTAKGAEKATKHLLDEIVRKLGGTEDTRLYMQYAGIFKLWQLLQFDGDEARKIAEQYEDKDAPSLIKISFDRDAIKKWRDENPQVEAWFASQQKLKVVKDET